MKEKKRNKPKKQEKQEQKEDMTKEKEKKKRKERTVLSCVLEENCSTLSIVLQVPGTINIINGAVEY